MSYRVDEFTPIERSIGLFAARPINMSAPGRRTPEHITVMVLHRIAHLIYRLEANPSWQTAVGAKWVLSQVERLLPKIPVVEQYVERLTIAVAAFEAIRGKRIEPTQFARLIQFANRTADDVLLDYGFINVTRPGEYGEPIRVLSDWITNSMWTQSTTGWG